MAVGKAHVFPGFITPVLTQLFFPKPPTTFLRCFCRGERQKIPWKESSPEKMDYYAKLASEQIQTDPFQNDKF